MKTLLITGGSGFVGGNLSFVASSRWKYCTTFHSSSARNQGENAFFLDITNKESVEKMICDISPNVIIHAAAVANMNISAENSEYAMNVNVRGTENVALTAEKVRARLVYLSTDLVFSGNKSMSSEEDIPEPVCFYGKTKLEGEKVVASLSSDFCIARMALCFGLSLNSSRCFAECIVRELKHKKEVRLFTDEFRSPIYINNLCEILLELAERDDLPQLLHICGQERLSRYDFGVRLAKKFDFDEDLIIPCSADEFSFSDRRPKDCSMKNDKASRCLRTRFWEIEESLMHMKNMWDQKINSGNIK